MSHWIFQGNPDRYDVDTYIRENTEINWLVSQKHLAPDMQPGDEVFIWRAAGRNGGIAGVVAHGVPTSAPQR
ncbi:MAG: EVE domain-containing protein [SAR202 cluster bacterium]|nr:EVE domain-containing protein [SAR202 cluster bacterium]